MYFVVFAWSFLVWNSLEVRLGELIPCFLLFSPQTLFRVKNTVTLEKLARCPSDWSGWNKWEEGLLRTEIHRQDSQMALLRTCKAYSLVPRLLPALNAGNNASVKYYAFLRRKKHIVPCFMTENTRAKCLIAIILALGCGLPVLKTHWPARGSVSVQCPHFHTKSISSASSCTLWGSSFWRCHLSDHWWIE